MIYVWLLESETCLEASHKILSSYDYDDDVRYESIY